MHAQPNIMELFGDAQSVNKVLGLWNILLSVFFTRDNSKHNLTPKMRNQGKINKNKC